MADVAITPVELTINTKSGDILDADGVAIANAGANEFVIDGGGIAGARLLIKFFDGGAAGDTVVFTQGDRPPSQRADLGETGTEIDDGGLDLTLAADDVRYIVVEAGRFLHDDGKIRATCGDNATECLAFLLPKIE